MFACRGLVKAPSRFFAIGLALFAVTAPECAKAVPVVSVQVDQATVTSVPEGTKTLIVGSPIIADVTLLKGANTMVVTGKGYGETNMIALDGRGNVLEEKLIRVEPSKSVLVVQRGMSRETYSCTPQCMPMVELGDASDPFSLNSGQINSRNSMAGPASTPTTH
jgi:Pilus formation protein N terminal region